MLGDRCGQACWDTPECTHFSWTNYSGGTCMLKNGFVTRSDAVYSAKNDAVCGIIR